jgi:hypothetical protein
MTAIYFGKSADDLVAVRAPVEIKQTFSDLDSGSTTRTASGKMVRSVVRGGADNIRKLELSWELLPEEAAREILNLISGTFFWVKYPDVQTGGYRTAQFYTGDRACEFKRIEADGKVMIANMSFNVIER